MRLAGPRSLLKYGGYLGCEIVEVWEKDALESKLAIIPLLDHDALTTGGHGGPSVAVKLRRGRPTAFGSPIIKSEHLNPLLFFQPPSCSLTEEARLKCAADRDLEGILA